MIPSLYDMFVEVINQVLAVKGTFSNYLAGRYVRPAKQITE
ncbi:hypothetical protein [Photobacterium nomapromontoriensis]